MICSRYAEILSRGRINPVPLIKEALGLIGIDVGGPRLPPHGASKEERKKWIEPWVVLYPAAKNGNVEQVKEVLVELELL
jgi:dihydrodipicolinate synthase/N-acetylneuraminate lyase